MKFVLFFILAAAGIASAIAGRWFLSRRRKYLKGMNDFLERCRGFDGVVLDVSDVPVDGAENIIHAVILQFRDEEFKRTIIHRYTGSTGRRYYRGDKVRVYYCEETDSACIKNDNPFYRKAKACGFAGAMLNLAAAGAFAASMAALMS